MVIKRKIVSFFIGTLLAACSMQPGQYGYNAVAPVDGQAVVDSVIGDTSLRALPLNLLAPQTVNASQTSSPANVPLMGAMLNGTVRELLTAEEMALHEQTAQRALETLQNGVSATWSGANSGKSGRIMPTSVLEKPEGIFCREYQQEIMVEQFPYKAYSMACRQKNGYWIIENQ